MNTLIPPSVTLNEAQQQAVLHHRGTLLVSAGAGSGKTRVITTRISHLINHHQVPPSHILAVTFTNKAAHEMKDRVAHLLGHYEQLPFIGTFHAYSVRLLKRYGIDGTTRNFSILDEDDRLRMLRHLITTAGCNKRITPQQMASFISSRKCHNPLVSEEGQAFIPVFIQELFHAYEKQRKESQSLDFDDLLLETLKLLNSHPEIRTMHQAGIRHILVDEYQDTNSVQHSLLNLMSLKEDKSLAIDSVCIVGDEDQSIYSWRGANVANMQHFIRDFPDVQIIKIEQNYRSIQPILSIANEIIRYNKNRVTKQLWSDKKGTDRIRSYVFSSEYHEADAIAALALSMQRHHPQHTVAVLYRTHAQSRALEEACIKNSLAYKIIGGIQFYERREIKDLLAYLRLIVNPFDRTAFMRVLNVPSRGLGEKCIATCLEQWQQQPLLTFDQLINQLLEQKVFTATRNASLNSFRYVFQECNSQDTPSVVLENIIKTTNYQEFLRQEYQDANSDERLANVQELIDAARHLEQNGSSTIESFLHEIALLQSIQARQTDEKNNQSPLFMMTLHTAKGLEFDLVILPGLEEGILPSSRSMLNNESIEEERRLLYVGITRARERLVLTHARHRHTYGRLTDQLPSRFFHEIPSSLVKSEGLFRLQPGQINSLWNDWLIEGPATSAPHSLTASKRIAKRVSNTSTWSITQKVTHASFGTGIVMGINDQILTIKFQQGIKKVHQSFVTIND